MSAFKNYRQNFIELSTIYGVDLEKGTYTPHPDFANYKETIREEVMESLAMVADPSNIPAIELYLDDEGLIHVVDGQHRIENAVRNYMNREKEVWGRIKYERFSGTREDAQFKAFTSALSDSRSQLTDAEEFKGVSRWIHLGYDATYISTKLGRTSNKWVNKINDIIALGVPAIEKAVRDGQLDVNTAVQISRKIEPAKQKEILEAAIEESKEAGGNISGATNTKQSKIRSALGLAQRTRKVRPFNEIKEHVLSIWDKNTAAMWDSGELNESIIGEFTGIAFCLGVDNLTQADLIEYFDDWFWKEEEKEQAVIKKQTETKETKKKATTKAPWQVKS